MKTTTSSAVAEVSASTTHLPQLSFGFGDGFRQFLASSPVIDEAADAFQQPTRYLEAVPTTVVDDLLNRSFYATQQSIAHCLTTSLLLATRPTQRSATLADAVAALKKAVA